MKVVENTKSKESQMNVEQTDNSNSSELIQKEELTGTPFTVVTTEEGSFGVMGKYRITEIGEKQAIIDELSYIEWDRIIQVCMLLIEEITGTKYEID